MARSRSVSAWRTTALLPLRRASVAAGRSSATMVSNSTTLASMASSSCRNSCRCSATAKAYRAPAWTDAVRIQLRRRGRLKALASAVTRAGSLAAVSHVLRTERLVLRPVATQDHARLLAHWTAPEVRRFLFDGAVLSPEEITAIIED